MNDTVQILRFLGQITSGFEGTHARPIRYFSIQLYVKAMLYFALPLIYGLEMVLRHKTVLTIK